MFAAGPNLFESLELGIWLLFVVCYLLFGACNFLYSKMLLLLNTLFDFINVFMGHSTRTASTEAHDRETGFRYRL